jgi:hypothetical protein
LEQWSHRCGSEYPARIRSRWIAARSLKTQDLLGVRLVPMRGLHSHRTRAVATLLFDRRWARLPGVGRRFFAQELCILECHSKLVKTPCFQAKIALTTPYIDTYIFSLCASFLSIALKLALSAFSSWSDLCLFFLV